MKTKKLFVHCRKLSAEVIFRSSVSLILFVLMFAGVSPVRAAEGDVEWIKTIATEHTRPAKTYTVTATVAPDGSVYVLGDTDGVLGNQTQVGNADLFLQKYNPAGEQVWVRQFGSTEVETGVEIAADSGGVYVAGNTWGAFDGFSNADGQLDGVVLKFDPDGNLVWSDEIGTNYQTFVKGIAITSDSLYVTGWTYGSFDDPNAGARPADAYLRKYSLDGALQWARSYGAEYTDEADGVAADESGAYVAGYYGTNRNLKKFSPEGDVLWSNDWMLDIGGNTTVYNVAVAGSRVYLAGSTISPLPGETQAGDWDAYIVTFDSENGSQGWLHQFGTPAQEFFSSLDADSSGVTVGGTTRGAFDGFSNAGSVDGFIRRYTSEGIDAGTLQFGSAGSDWLSGIAADAAGIYVVGKTTGVLDGQSSSGGEDIFLKKVDLSLNSLWTAQFNSTSYIPENEFGRAVDAHGDVYLAGNISFNNRDNPYDYQSSILLAKYSSDGVRQWMDNFHSVTDGLIHTYDQASSVATDAQGNVYLAGLVSGVLPGQTGSGGYADAFLRKYDSSGSVLWTRQFGTDQGDNALEVAVFEGVVYVAGITTGQMGSISFGGSDVYIRQFSPDGSTLWTEQFGSSSTDSLTGLAVDGSGVYVGGTTSGALEGFANAGSYDGYLRKYNLDGSVAWTKEFGGTGVDEVGDIAVYDSNLYVTGQTSGSLNDGSNIIQNDAFIQKYSPDGEVLWSRPVGSERGGNAEGIAVDSTGAYMVGWAYLSGGSVESFMYKYSLDGEQAWSRPFDKQTEVSAVRGVAIDGNALYVSGSVWVLDHFRSDDAVLLKMSLAEGNQAPEVGAISAPAAPVEINTEITASASFTDADTSDTHTAEWGWGDGTTSAGTVIESGGSGAVSGSHTYTIPGVYQLTLTVTDSALAEGSATYQYVVVYDPSAGFVTGGGWIDSPAGAYKADETLAGKATFGFVSKYQKGTSVPTGNTAFEFDLAGLAFSSESYEWLVVNKAATNAQFKGSGLINGSADPNGNLYRFMLWAGDGSPDTFRIRIWWEDAAGEHDVYDNGAAQAIGAGNVVVHTGK